MITLVGNCPRETDAEALRKLCLELNQRAEALTLFHEAKASGDAARNTAWRISPEPFCISRTTLRYLQDLGNHLLAFYRASNKLYQESVKGQQPAWVADYLDRGKPEGLIDYGRMNRGKQQLPAVIRPDLIFTDDGRAIACELDAVPGGMGITAALNREYERLGYGVVGNQDAMLRGYAAMIRDTAGKPDPRLAIVVSRESNDYWQELEWLGRELDAGGLPTRVVRPDDLRYDEGLFVEVDGHREPIDVLYRFFELFDLKNVPRTELVMYAHKKQQAVVTPPFKAYLEEKSLFALFHHPMLAPFWERELGEATCGTLGTLFPRTWILDPRELPPSAVIPDLRVKGRPVSDWKALIPTTKKEREFVVKPSGFSELAWGSHGIAFGSDTPAEEWPGVLDRALASFPKTPYLLQEFHKPAKLTARYYDFERDAIRDMDGRARLCPYYFVAEGRAELAGVLATIVPSDKKAIHGMVDAIMVPCMVEGEEG